MHPKVFVCGSTASGKIGIEKGNRGNIQDIPTELEIKEYIVQISVSDEHSFLITREGRVLAFGNARYNMLGLGDSRPEVCKPTVIPSLKKYCIEQISSCFEHNIALARTGEVFTWGIGSHGQLGHGDFKDQPLPKIVEFFVGKKTKIVSGGALHSVVATCDNKLYTFGGSNWCGFGPSSTNIVTPKELVQFANIPIRKISADNSTCVLTEDGEVFAWGYNGQCGKCGTGSREDTIAVPTKIKLPQRAIDVAVGFDHTLICTESGLVFACGSSESGQIGMDVPHVLIPQRITALDHLHIKKVFAGYKYSMFVTNNGEVYGLGKSRNGELGVGTSKGLIHTKPVCVNFNGVKIETISCGAHHTLFLQKIEGMFTNSIFIHNPFFDIVFDIK